MTQSIVNIEFIITLIVEKLSGIARIEKRIRFHYEDLEKSNASFFNK